MLALSVTTNGYSDRAIFSLLNFAAKWGDFVIYVLISLRLKCGIYKLLIVTRLQPTAHRQEVQLN